MEGGDPGAAATPPELTCIVCLDLFDDPCFCADGWTYCRLCIARWARTGAHFSEGYWKSPRTNELLRLPAVLRTNEAAATAVLEEKASVLCSKMRAAAERPEEALRAAACTSERGRPVLEAGSFELELQEVARALDWQNLSAEQASRAFAEALSVVVRSHEGRVVVGDPPWRRRSWEDDVDTHFSFGTLHQLLRTAGPEAPRALIARDLGASRSPLLRLGVLKDLLTAAVEIYQETERSQEWLRLVQDLLEHVSHRNTMVDSIEVPAFCFAKHKTKAPGTYVRCDRQWRCPPGIVRFICVSTGAFLDVQLWPAEAVGSLESGAPPHGRGSAVISPMEGILPIVFESRVQVSLEKEEAWELRRASVGPPPFPDYDPCWAERRDWPFWGDEDALGIFEDVPEALPAGFVYSSSAPAEACRRDEELGISRALLRVLFSECLEPRGDCRPVKRRRR